MTQLPGDLFSVAPKTSLSGFYDREAELAKLRSAIRYGSRLVLVLGVRRVGKTSLLRAALSTIETPYIFLDLRALPTYEDRSLYSLLAEELNRALPLKKKVLDFLMEVRGISVGAEGVSIDLSKGKPSLISVLKALDRWSSREGFNLPVVLDEVQELRFFQGGRRGLDFRRLLAYCYDNLEHITFILSGSEVGLIYKFLALDDPKSPLFGRHHERILVDRLDRDRSVDFLRKGFRQHAVEVDDGVLGRVVDELDGIIGWLTYFGAEYVRTVREGGQRDPEEILQRIRSNAVALCASELEEISVRSPLYIGLLAELRGGLKTFTELKHSLEKVFKRTISKQQLARLINTLRELSLIEKVDNGYRALDPLIPDAAELLLKSYARRL
jgi:AAA+ ATPase superfamily predicted ATPase